jgi:hypothetical protein
MASTDEQLDELMAHCKKHEDPTGEGGFLSQLFRTTLQLAKQSGMTELPDNAPPKKRYS